MTTSGTNSFTLTRDELIEDAFDVLRAALGKPSSSVTTSEKARATRILDMLAAEWQVEGVGLWKDTEITLTLVVDQASYEIGPSGDTTDPVLTAAPNSIIEARFVYTAGNERPLNEISLDEYTGLSDKTTSGKPTQYYYKTGSGNATLYLWPVPDLATDTVVFTGRLPIEDFGDTDDNPDFPIEWFNALKWNLISNLAPHYKEYFINEKTFAKIEGKAAMSYQNLRDHDRETSSVYFEAE